MEVKELKKVNTEEKNNNKKRSMQKETIKDTKV